MSAVQIFYERHEAGDVHVDASPETVFAILDDHRQLSGHMERSSWRTAWSSMRTTLDALDGRVVGSRIEMTGRVLGIPIGLEERVAVRDPPRLKEWRTDGEPRLLVIGRYALRARLDPEDRGTRLRVEIDYDLPTRGRWLGRALGWAYARWCVRQMLHDVSAKARPSTASGVPAAPSAPA